MKKPIAIVALVGAAALALSGCSPQPTAESVALSFTQAVFGDSDTSPSALVCDGSTIYDDLFVDPPATDIKVSEVEPIGGNGNQRIWVTYVHPKLVSQRLIVTVNTADLCVVSVQ